MNLETLKRRTRDNHYEQLIMKIMKRYSEGCKKEKIITRFAEDMRSRFISDGYIIEDIEKLPNKHDSDWRSNDYESFIVVFD